MDSFAVYSKTGISGASGEFVGALGTTRAVQPSCPPRRGLDVHRYQIHHRNSVRPPMPPQQQIPLCAKCQGSPQTQQSSHKFSGGHGFSNALFLSLWQPNTVPDTLESVIGGDCVLLSLDSAAEARVIRAPSAGYSLSLGRFHRYRKPSDAADSSGPGRRVAWAGAVRQRQAACSAWPRAGARGVARACRPRCLRIFSITGASMSAVGARDR